MASLWHMNNRVVMNPVLSISDLGWEVRYIDLNLFSTIHVHHANPFGMPQGLNGAVLLKHANRPIHKQYLVVRMWLRCPLWEEFLTSPQCAGRELVYNSDKSLDMTLAINVVDQMLPNG